MKQTPNSNTRGDIENEADVRRLVDTFYENVREDALIGPIFDDMVKDWNTHLPTMYAFWSRLLLGKEGYAGNPWMKHAQLPVEKAHFTKWLELFMFTIESLFEGPCAEHAKGSAKSIAHSFQVRMGIDPFITVAE
tara:strand:- start:1180 stop:1584 length:405 start_codon:yes stop_codon:yes gene_type:complete